MWHSAGRPYSPSPEGHSPLAAGLPHPRRVLVWMYAGRLLLGITVLANVGEAWGAASLMLLAAGALTAASFRYTHLLQCRPGSNFLYLQVFFDTLLVTWTVHLTGGVASAFSPLYLLVIFAAVVLLPLTGGILIGLLASLLYFAAIVWGAQGSGSGAVLLQGALFTTVALVTGYLGDRLRQTGTVLDTVETELQQLRVTTDQLLASSESRAERLEAVAALSASLAHEIRNPLASIRSAVEQLAGSGVDPEDCRILRRLVVRESERLSRRLGEFLDFARAQVPVPQPVNLSRLVGEVVQLVRAHPDARGRALTLAVAEEELLVRGAEDLLHRAVLNLVLNAVQWAGGGGRVEIALDRLESDLLSPAPAGGWIVRLRVSDNGPGVPPELAEQIFDPFFSCRPGGTGLGLALVKRVAQTHGGTLVLDLPRPSGSPGASFTLYLPTLCCREGVRDRRARGVLP